MITLILLAGLYAQVPPEVAVFRAGTNEVLVDVVVRDKKSRLITGLRAADITLLEDGVAQQITGFREVKGTASIDALAPGAKPEPAPLRQARLVSLVFERLGPDGRRLGRQAALDFVARDLGPNVYYAVFTVDRRFSVLQSYTNNRPLLKAAIERATSGVATDFANDNAALDRMSAATSGSEGAAAALSSSSGPGGPGPVEGGSLSGEQAARMVANMSEFSVNIAREELGRMSIFSLWAIIEELSKLPGRKSVLYFAEGLQMPNGLVQQFKSLQSAANRSNVTVYAIDARGLTATGDQAAATAALQSAAAKSRYQTRTTETNGTQDFRTMDIAMDSIRANGQNTLAELAESTGGFLIANTNDMRPQLRHLSEELNSYYEISFRSSNSNYDGRFRNLTVKVNRPDAVVQSRSGYFSLPPMLGQAVFPYEVPLLQLLARSPFPKDVEYRAQAILFRSANGIRQVSLIFDLPLKDVAFTANSKSGVNRMHMTVLALIKDDKGQVVGKLSRDVALDQPADKLSGFKQGRLIVTRPIRLAPGRYTVESAAADQEGRRAAAKKAVLVIPQMTPGPVLSGLSLVRRIDKPSETPDPDDPLQIPQGRVIPTLVDSIPGGKGSLLSVFFTLYPQQDLGSAQLLLELLQDDKLLTSSQPALPAADAKGAIPYLANIPVESLASGQYEFRASVIQGKLAAKNSLFVTVIGKE